jgi:deoxyribodipyrimidine photolyase-related protein
MDIPIASKEGFIRQVLGWREFMAHVHRETDGFRDLDDTEQVALPTDGGYGRWRSRPFQPSETPPRLTGHAAPARLDSVRPVPPAFWGRRSGLRCLDHVVESVWSEAYSHHIPRLMILANLATLLGISPRAITDWFWVAYVDAYDWVVEPNVLGMGTFALGDLFTTKPYVSGAAYIDRMSDYCGKCEFDPKKNCPITPLYWSFLSDNGTTLEGNARMAMPMRSLAKRKSEQRKRDRATKQWVLDTLWEGRALDPDDAP